jgi:hypothetical protein
MSDTLDLISATFAKTATGQQEIQTRSLGLAPLVRRVLVLADGKKSGRDLGAFVSGGEDIKTILEQLLSLGCLEAKAQAKAAAAEPAAAKSEASAGAPKVAATPDAGSDQYLAGLASMVPAEKRTAKDNEMARNFMINSVNSIIGQNMRLSLIHDIFHAQTTEELRLVYLHWETTMSEHGMGSKRLPELREKLFKVL